MHRLIVLTLLGSALAPVRAPALPDSNDVTCIATLGRGDWRILYPGITFVEFVVYNGWHAQFAVRITGLGYEGQVFPLELVNDSDRRSARVPIDPTLGGCVNFDLLWGIDSSYFQRFTYRMATAVCP